MNTQLSLEAALGCFALADNWNTFFYRKCALECVVLEHFCILILNCACAEPDTSGHGATGLPQPGQLAADGGESDAAVS